MSVSLNSSDQEIISHFDQTIINTSSSTGSDSREYVESSPKKKRGRPLGSKNKRKKSKPKSKTRMFYLSQIYFIIQLKIINILYNIYKCFGYSLENFII